MPFNNHLKSHEDLITPYEETRAGFIALALEKNRTATPFVEEAKVLKVFASRAKTPKELLEISEYKIHYLRPQEFLTRQRLTCKGRIKEKQSKG